MDALAEVAPMADAAGEKLLGLLGRAGFHAPLLKPGDLHGGVKRFQLLRAEE